MSANNETRPKLTNKKALGQPNSGIEQTVHVHWASQTPPPKLITETSQLL